MNKNYIFAIAAALVAAPMAIAHTDGGLYGTPKTYCEDVKGDTYAHDYGPVASGYLLAFAVDGAVPPCPYDPLWDGHYEWAAGGAWILACEASCGGYGGKKLGDGSLVCWETYADHEAFPSLSAFDHVLTPLGIPVLFAVAADYWDNVPSTEPEPNCGDFESDVSSLCIQSCSVTIPPGKDGSYQVYVCTGTFGHIEEVFGPKDPSNKLKDTGCPLGGGILEGILPS